MRSFVPVQFIKVNGHPIISYSMQRMDKHPEIDAICVVCIPGWEKYIAALVKREGFSKVKWIVTGGPTFHESVANSVFALRSRIPGDSMVLFQYAESPLVSAKNISDALTLASVRKDGCPAMLRGYSLSDFAVQIRKANGDIMSLDSPHAMPLQDAFNLYKEAYSRNAIKSVDHHTACMMQAMGKEPHFCASSDINFRIIKNSDLALFKRLLELNAK